MPFPTKDLFRKEAESDIPVVPYAACAAKSILSSGAPGTSVPDHCLHAGYVAQALADLLPQSLRHLLTRNPALAAALHDVGKVSPGFQCKYFCDSIVRQYAPTLQAAGYSDRHAAIGAAAIEAWQQKRSSPVAYAAAMHHGSGDRSHPVDDAGVHGGPSWARERRKLIGFLEKTFVNPESDWEKEAHSRLLSGLVSVSDWIASDETFFPPDAPPRADQTLTQLAAEALDQCGFSVPPIQRGLSFQTVFGFPPNAPQSAFLDQVNGPGLYVLEAPMGLGKTEAALYAAYRLMADGVHRGLYFALPTRLTSDRIHERVCRFLRSITPEKAAEPLLAHGQAWLRTFEHGGADAGAGQSWFHPLKRALLHPYAVGTIDQALLGVLNVRHFFVRQFGLAGKVVILDEIHSYDMYTGTLLDALVKTLLELQCTVIILSATLTAPRRQSLSPRLADIDSSAYPLVTAAPVNGKASADELPPPTGRICRIRMESSADADVAEQAVDAAVKGHCVVCLANTVSKAQTWFKAVRAAMRKDQFAVGLLHARFPAFRRQQIEKEWLGRLGSDSSDRPEGCVLVATQILEQSVDIDADMMISELAPSDMLLQRMGRLWRHQRAKRPCDRPVFVIVTNDPADASTRDEVAEILGKSNCLIYAPYVLMRTHAVWRDRREVRLPEDIRTLIEATYSDNADDASLLRELREHLATQRDKLRRLALANLEGADSPETSDSEDAATRYNSYPTRTILPVQTVSSDGSTAHARVRLLSGETLELDKFQRNLYATRLLHANTVSIARYLLPDSAHSPHWLDKHFHDGPIVLVWDEHDGALRTMNGDPTGLGYTPDYGIFRIESGSLGRVEEPDFREDPVFDPFDKSRLDW